jgi:signal transduction histidine kinase
MDSVESTYSRQQAESSGLNQFLPTSLRGRFLAVLFGVLLPSLTLFGVLHHDAVRRSLLREIDKTLANRAKEVKQVLQAQGVRTENDFREFHPVSSALELTSAPEVYVEIVSEDGRVLWKSENLGHKSLPLAVTNSQLEVLAGSVTQADGLRLRYLTERFRLSDGTNVVLATAESLSHTETALRGSVGRTMLLGLVVLVLTEIVANMAFRGVFRPLRRLVTTTEEIIETGDMSQRVKVYESSDAQIRRTAQAFNALLERVEQLLEMAQRLLADTSHELRNPLTVLMTDLDLLREELSKEQRDEVVSEAQDTVRRLNRLVSDLLLLSRAEAASEILMVEDVEVEKFVRKVAERFSRAYDRDVVRVESVPDSAVGRFSRERTEQILTNLFENGVRHSPDDPVTINIFREPGQLVVSVKDEGCGIEPKEQEKIFHRFYRVDPSRDRDSGGTGLGLAVARALARLQGGDIIVASAVGAGADFRLTLPASE